MLWWFLVVNSVKWEAYHHSAVIVGTPLPPGIVGEQLFSGIVVDKQLPHGSVGDVQLPSGCYLRL